MSLIQIRDVDEAVRQRLKERAATEGVSLNALLKALLERESQLPSRAEVISRLRSRGDLVPGSSVEVLQAARGERDEQLRTRSDRR